MTVGIVGLGLIGGSFAKAYHEAGERVLAWNRTASTLEFAMLSSAVDGALNEENIAQCDLVLLTLYPKACVEYLKKMAPYVGARPVVVDCGGTKREVCEACFALAREHGFTFVGGHPMAGTHNSGFKYARANLYHGAPMVLVPKDRDDIALLGRCRELLSPVGFGRFSVTDAETHDRMIAFTSQLAHVVSNAYVKSPTAGEHKGFSAGSYKDLTRVAWLSAPMWTELFLENRDFLLAELDSLIASLGQYRDALAAEDAAALEALLEEGKRRKEEIDGR